VQRFSSRGRRGASLAAIGSASKSRASSAARQVPAHGPSRSAAATARASLWCSRRSEEARSGHGGQRGGSAERAGSERGEAIMRVRDSRVAVPNTPSCAWAASGGLEEASSYQPGGVTVSQAEALLEYGPTRTIFRFWWEPRLQRMSEAASRSHECSNMGNRVPSAVLLHPLSTAPAPRQATQRIQVI
jgi:hypothetical protein